MAVDAHPDFSEQLDLHPPVVRDLETAHASGSSDLHAHAHPTTHPPRTVLAQPKSNNRPPPPSLTIRPRAVSTVSSTSPSQSPVRRKPLPVTASPLATRYSSGERLYPAAVREHTFERAYAVDSPTLYKFPLTSTAPFTPARSSTYTQKTFSRESLAESADTSDDPKTLKRVSSTQTTTPRSLDKTVPSQIVPSGTSLRQEDSFGTNTSLTSTTAAKTDAIGAWFGDSGSSVPSSATMSVFSAKPTPPHNITVPNPLSRTFSHDSTDTSATIHKSPQKSPGGSKLGSFFGWGANGSPASSTTSFSEKGFSPIPSTPSGELDPNASRNLHPKTNKPKAIDVPKANADAGSYFPNTYLQLPLATPTTPIQVEEMERELKDISSELASSIRREMDLEDLVERLQGEAQSFNNTNKRTSDYFSDSGVSSTRSGDADAKQDDLDRALRKTEQEKAQIRLELTNKVQEERTRRKQLERQIHNLEEKASHVDLASMNSLDVGGRIRDLEATCEDLRRRLADEREAKNNFEDLLTALKSELQSSHNERDNLRDEIVPQLRARIDGLEAQAARDEKLNYEQSKLQQELAEVKKENSLLISNQKKAMETQQQMKKFDSISEDDFSATPIRPVKGLARSSSLAHGSVNRSRPSSLSRSVSVKATESRDALAERVKDVELQRDALHAALRNLLDRQEHQNRENQKKIRQLEAERDRALSSSPRRMGYDREVATLRQEINMLRRRADEAIEQKWQCEKGLSGLKMDLDRAEQEIGSLKSLLKEKDILIPTGTRERHETYGPRPGSSHVSSESLELAYMELKKEYSESLERVKNLELSGAKDAETEKAMSLLQQNLADAIIERDLAAEEANQLRQSTDSLRLSEKNHIGHEQAMAEELHGSAKRVEDLAIQVRQQLASNSSLRQRLSETVERGEKEQQSNTKKITFMQAKLKTLEDKLMAAQQSSEDTISRHEEEIRDIKESHNVQLQRMKDGMRSPRLFAPKSPISPMFANSTKAPRLLSTSSGQALSVSEDSKMSFLKQRVTELEAALAEADTEMEEVVSRMNIAQIEVMELQNEREEAVRETRRLQKMIEEERIKAFENKFATLSS